MSCTEAPLRIRSSALAPVCAGNENSSKRAGRCPDNPTVSTGTSASGWSISIAVNVTSAALRNATTVPAWPRATKPRNISPRPATNRSSSHRAGRHTNRIHCATEGSTLPSAFITPNRVNSEVQSRSKCTRRTSSP